MVSGAHPRSRGENPCWRRRTSVTSGSSPLTRGKPAPGLLTVSPTGLIPAHAGKTPRSARGHPPPGAHPRSRGENVHAPTKAPSGYGSSPLTRGKHRCGLTRLGGRGLIPAHAGKTPDATPCDPARRAHPRSRGENVMSTCACCALTGSSPLTRGKRTCTHHGAHHRGLIPAHAGKTPQDGGGDK